MSEAERLSAELRKLSADMTQGDPVTAAMLVRAAIFISEDKASAALTLETVRAELKKDLAAWAKRCSETEAYAELTTRALKAVVEESARCPLDVSDADAILARIREAADTALAKSESEIGPQCNPTLTECPRCKNDISKCDGTFVGIQSAKAEERHAVGRQQDSLIAHLEYLVNDAELHHATTEMGLRVALSVARTWERHSQDSHWIPVGSELPQDDGVSVLVATDDPIESVRIAWLAWNQGQQEAPFWCCDDGARPIVTHWMPLPEVPNAVLATFSAPRPTTTPCNEQCQPNGCADCPLDRREVK